MKDIKELIYAAVEENAVKFQELVNAQLQVRAYDAIEALRPEVGASMFGEAKKMDDEDEGDIFRDRINDFDPEDEDEDEMDNKKKSMKEALHPNQQKIDVVDDEKIDAKDFAKLRQMKKMKEEVEQIDEASYNKDSEHHRNARKVAKSMGGKATYHPNGHASVSFQDVVHGRSTVNPKGTVLSTGEEDAKRAAKSHGGKAVGNVVHFKEEVEQIDESVFDSKDAAQAVVNKLKAKHDDGNYHVVSNRGKHRVVHAYDSNYTVKKKIAALKEEADEKKVGYKIAHARGSEYAATATPIYKTTRSKTAVKAAKERAEKEMADAHAEVKKTPVSKFLQTRKGDGKVRTEETVNEVAMPKNAADWQALITHQIQTVGHPVATDAQFRAQHGKDMSKKASLEPGQDKMHYAAAQGGTVKA